MPFLVFVVGIMNTGWPRLSPDRGQVEIIAFWYRKMYHLSNHFQKIAFRVSALYDARQHGDLASAFSKVQERGIANSKTAFCKTYFCILRIPISAFAKSENLHSRHMKQCFLPPVDDAQKTLCGCPVLDHTSSHFERHVGGRSSHPNFAVWSS